MTQDSRAAFEYWRKNHTRPRGVSLTESAWQASEQRILELLDSSKMAEVVEVAIEQAALNRANSNTKITSSKIVTNEFATAALAAIKQKIGE